jgi:hypothetical protein
MRPSHAPCATASSQKARREPVSDPPRDPRNLPVPIDNLVQDFLQVVKGADPGARPRPADPDKPLVDPFTQEVLMALREVAAALDSPQMATFFARSYSQGNAYDGPKIDMERLRSLIARAEERGYLPKGAA